MKTRIGRTLLTIVSLAVSAPAAEVGFLEDFSLAEDRTLPLQQLIPGTEDYYYYQCVHWQNAGQFDKVEETLKPWIGRHGETARVEEIRNRQALLTYDKDPKASLTYLQRVLGLRWDHTRQVPGEKPTHPSRLDQQLFDRATLTQRALNEHRDLSGFNDRGLASLATANLDGDRRRDLLRRLKRPDYPGLVRLVTADLGHPNSQGFGSMPIHRQMLLPQLDELAALHPALRNEKNFVNTYLAKLRPPDHVDWRHDSRAREAYLDRLWAFVEKLEPAHNSLKAHILHQRLAHDRASGLYDKGRFLEYLKLPRRAPYANPVYLERPEHRGYPANLAQDFREVTLLPPAANDEPLVRDYLTHFFVTDENYDSYSPYLLDRYLKEVFAETKILHGLGDSEKWYSMLNDPAKYQAIKDRIEVEFAPSNKTFFMPGEPVGLELDLKNVKTLIVKVFEVNTFNYYREKRAEIDTGVDLDGLVASEEKTYNYTDPPTRRMRRLFAFPALDRAGVFVIDFIGNGKSSRALVRKGQLRFLERLGAAGHVLTLLDEANRKVTNGTVWLAGHEYPASTNATVVIPYTHEEGPQSILISRGGFASLAQFHHRDESYELLAELHVERESLLARVKAKALLRPTLKLHERPVALSLLEDPSLVIQATDLDGVASTREIKGLALSAESETEVEFQVPERVVQLQFTLTGRVQSLSKNEKIELHDSRTITLNQVDATSQIEGVHLSRLPGSYLLRVLGKNGEPRPDQPARLSLKHRDFNLKIETTVQTDAAGRIDLGALAELSSLEARTAEDAVGVWELPEDQHTYTYPDTVHGRVGDPLSVPYMGRASEPAPALFALLEKRGDTYVEDRFKALALKPGFVEVQDLAAGEYELVLKESGRVLTLRLEQGEARDGYVLGADRLLQVRNPAPLQIETISADEREVTIRLANPSAFTRVHVAATRFLEGIPIFGSLARMPAIEPDQVSLDKLDSIYLAGRDIGDEYRYILERKYASKFPGNLLSRPGLLLNPRAVRQTETLREVLRAGAQFAPSPAPAMAMPAETPAMMYMEPAAKAPSASLDFLPRPSVLLANLRPDANGIVTIARTNLGDGQHLHVLALNPENAAYRQWLLPEVKLTPRDMRLKDGLDPAKHFTQQNRVSPLAKGQALTVPDITTARLEAYDSLAKAYRLLVTLSGDTNLVEFGFLLEWPRLKPDEKRVQYSRYACHELSFFLFKKDPAFFAATILPYLKNKRDKTFLDHWLLGDDLGAFLQPWAYEQLNVVERILLGQRRAGEPAAAARHVKDLFDLLPPNLERTNHLFLTAIAGGALETSDALGLRAAGEKALAAREERLAQTVAAPPVVSAATVPPPPAAAAPRSLALKSAAERPAEPAAKPLTSQPARAGRILAEAAKDRRFFAGESEGIVAADQAADASLRQAVRQLYRPMDQTQEWAENNYYHLSPERQNATLVAANAFWTDYARHQGEGPFLSVNLAEASHNFTEMMFALALLDLPLEAQPAEAAYQGAQLTLTANAPLVAFHQEILPSTQAKDAPPLLITQNFFRANDRFRFENGERQDKYVADEFLTHVVYGCRVVLTSPSSSPQKLDVLLQIPRGAIPVEKGFYTRTRPIALEPYSTTTFEFLFYFPVPGDYAHFPAHVSRRGELVAAAAPATLKVVDNPSRADTTSWDYISQQGTSDEVLAFLARENVNRLQLNRLAWRLRDRPFFQAVTRLLAARHVYEHTLWSYGLYHDDPAASREFLQHAPEFVGKCGSFLESALLSIDPVARRSYQHLEYSPLVNARTHQIGKRRQIFNDRLATQYQALLKVLSYRPRLDDTDLLAVTYYLLLQDRIAEGLRFFARIAPDKITARLQYDYMRAYLDFYTQDRKVARGIAEQYREYPVDRWRKVFQEVLAQLDELEGKGARVVDPASREQAQASLAASEGALDFALEGRKVTVHYQNFSQARVHYYLMDVELLFSRNPFVQQNAGHFAVVRANRTELIELPAGTNTLSFQVPDQFKNANLMIEIAAGGLERAQPCFANSLALQLVENYGQLQVTDQQSGAPLPQVYVKVYARLPNGSNRFYKDGYTDARGRFDYASLNSNDLDAVEKFSLLVLSETHGALIREASPPKR